MRDILLANPNICLGSPHPDHAPSPTHGFCDEDWFQASEQLSLLRGSCQTAYRTKPDQEVTNLEAHRTTHGC